MTRTMLAARLATGLAALVAGLGVQPAHAAGPAGGLEPSLAAQTVPVSVAVPASVRAAAAAAEGEVCDAGQTYRSRVFRTDTKRVVYTFNAFVKRCAIGDLAFTKELGFDIVEPLVPDPIIFTRLGSTSLPGRPPERIVTYEGNVDVDACFGNPCQRYQHKFFGTSTSTFQSGSFALIRLP